MKLHVFQVDSFTTELFKGNPAGVVLNADHVSEMYMQQIAREMNKSETAFIMNHKSEDGVKPSIEKDTCKSMCIVSMENQN
jgi:PhzF family phenazine biosynthesis protein